MSTEASTQMLALLAELSELKDSRHQIETQPSLSDTDHQSLQQLDRRRDEISQQMKTLADEKKHNGNSLNET